MEPEHSQIELKTIPGFENYCITKDGRVWSKPRRGRRGRWLKPAIWKQGYLQVVLCRDGEMHSYFVHQLVALVWIGLPPFEGAKVLHKDDIPSNNYYQNLYYGTQKDNIADAIRNGRIDTNQIKSIFGISLGEKNGNSKLTEFEVKQIKNLFKKGVSMDLISKRFSISRSTVEQIKYGKTWRNVS